jgi:hypothetical protein
VADHHQFLDKLDSNLQPRCAEAAASGAGIFW